MNKEIERYITLNYYKLLEIAKKICREQQQWAGDLLHFVILELYDKKEIKLRAFDNNNILYYITAIMRINYNSKTSPWHYKVMREFKSYNDVTDTILNVSVEQEQYETNLIMEIMEIEYAELSWFHKSVFDMYMQLESLKKVSKKTNIPLTSIARYVREAKQQVKINTLNKMDL
jgi:hypothetical protein